MAGAILFCCAKGGGKLQFRGQCPLTLRAQVAVDIATFLCSVTFLRCKFQFSELFDDVVVGATIGRPRSETLRICSKIRRIRNILPRRAPDRRPYDSNGRCTINCNLKSAGGLVILRDFLAHWTKYGHGNGKNWENG